MKVLRFLPGDEIPGFDSALLTAQKANEHLCTTEGKSRCSLWWDVVPKLENERLAVIGHFQADCPAAGSLLLERACDRLWENGCTLAVGPMDGNTWRRYRVLTERGAEPSFFMEPDNPDFWSTAFEAANFSPLARYSSSLVTDLSRRDPRAERAWKRLQQVGVRIRHLHPDEFEEELLRIYEVSISSFTGNYLYTELPEAAFLSQYLPYKQNIVPELVLLAEQEGRPAGYLFAVPDFAEALRGQTIRTVIGKTLAILPGRSYGGLGVVLADALHERTRALGYTRLIHALQHDGNRSRNLTEFFGEVMRRYTLYARRL
jgi:GNAT superfamily N-acetyltransferase